MPGEDKDKISGDATGTTTPSAGMSFEERLTQEMKPFLVKGEHTDSFPLHFSHEKMDRLFDDLLRAERGDWTNYPILAAHFHELFHESYKKAVDDNKLVDWWFQIGLHAYHFLFKSDGIYRDWVITPVQSHTGESISLGSRTSENDKLDVFRSLVKAWVVAYIGYYYKDPKYGWVSLDKHPEIRASDKFPKSQPPSIPKPKVNNVTNKLDLEAYEKAMEVYRADLAEHREFIMGAAYVYTYHIQDVFREHDVKLAEKALYTRFFNLAEQINQLTSGQPVDVPKLTDTLAELEFFWMYPEIGKFLFIVSPTENDWIWAKIAKDNQNTTDNTMLANLVRQHVTSKELAEFTRSLELGSADVVYRSAARRLVNENTGKESVSGYVNRLGENVNDWPAEEIKDFLKNPLFNEALADQSRKLLSDDVLAGKAKALFRRYEGKFEEYTGREAFLPYIQKKLAEFKTENKEKIKAKTIDLIKQQLNLPISFQVNDIAANLSSNVQSAAHSSEGFPLSDSLRLKKEKGLKGLTDVLEAIAQSTKIESNILSVESEIEQSSGNLPQEDKTLIENLKLMNSLIEGDNNYGQIVCLAFEELKKKRALAIRIEDFSSKPYSELNSKAKKRMHEEIQAFRDSVTELKQFEEKYREELLQKFDLMTMKSFSTVYLIRNFNAQVKSQIENINAEDFSIAYDSLARLTYLKEKGALPSTNDLNAFKVQKKKYLDITFSSMIFEKYKELEIARAKESIATARLELESASSQLGMDPVKFVMIKVNVATQISLEETRIKCLEDAALQYKLAAEVLSSIPGEFQADKPGFDAIAKALLESPTFHQQFDPIFKALLKSADKGDIAAQLKNHRVAEEFFIMTRQLLFRKTAIMKEGQRVEVIRVQPWVEMLLGKDFNKNQLVIGANQEQTAKNEEAFQQLFVSVFQTCIDSLSEQPKAQQYFRRSIPLDILRKQLKPVLDEKKNIRFNLVAPTSKKPQLPPLVLKRTEELRNDMVFFNKNLRGLEVDLLRLHVALEKEALKMNDKLKELEKKNKALPTNDTVVKKELADQISILMQQAQKAAENTALIANLAVEVHTIKEEFHTSRNVYKENISAVRQQTSDIQTQAQEIEQVNIAARKHMVDYTGRIEKVRDQFVSQLKREIQSSTDNSEQKEISPKQTEKLNIVSKILDWLGSLLSTKYYVREHADKAVEHAFKGFAMKTGGIAQKEERQDLTGTRPGFRPKVGGPK